MGPRDEYGQPDRDSAPPFDGDAVEHLWNAAHEMLRAMRTLVDAADEFVESQRGERSSARNRSEPREGRVHHIDIDVRSDSRAADSGAS
jgi:hypothetical protein